MPLPFFLSRDQHARRGGELASENGFRRGKKWRISALLRMRVRKDLGSLVQALRALRPLAERGVDRVRIAGAATRGAAQIRFPDGITDADVHSAALLTIRS
jgi:hypothetical protein